MRNRPVFLHSFCSILPQYLRQQSELVLWTLKAHEKNLEIAGVNEPAKLLSQLNRFCLSEKQIHKRYFECPDVDLNWDNHQIYSLTNKAPEGADILSRNLFFKDRAKEVFENFYPDDSHAPQHLIHVTCTGYISPSAAQIHFSQNPMAPEITHAYHMGCYAALPSIRIAKAFAQTGIQVDLVHTEMCSLHLDPSSHTPEQMVVQTLFADGHIKYTASPESKDLSFKVLGIKEKLIANSLDDMTWIPSAHGMKMTLSKEVPSKIKEQLKVFIKELCLECEEDENEILRNGYFAVHPGGPKIIDSVGDTLDLKEYQLKASSQVLRERGNMSSATLPHVWQVLLNHQIKEGSKVLSMAFGPGLTIFGSIFEVVS